MAKLSPDFAGRYGACFAELQRDLHPHVEELHAVLSLANVTEQVRRVAPDTPLGRKLDDVLDSVMSLPNLVALFGEGATRQQWSRSLGTSRGPIRHALATLPALTNPFLWQMLAGCYPADHPAD